MITKTKAEKLLEPYLPKLKECLDGGWTAWNRHYRDRHHVLDSRARASIVYCEIIDRAKNLFADDPDVTIHRKGTTYLLNVGNQIVLRFKKLKNGRPSNVRTRQQTLFEMQYVIPGVLPATIATAGYELDRIEQAIYKTMVLCQMSGEMLWSIDLNIVEEGKIEVMPTSAKETTKIRVRARKNVAMRQS